MFNFENVSKEFQTDFWAKPFLAFKEVSFNVKPGNIVGFLGANGAGKTTGIKMLLNFIKPTSGSIGFDKIMGSTQREIYRNIGYLPERPYFYPDLNGEEFLKYIGKLNDLKDLEIKQSVDKWAKLLKIDSALDRKLRFYSKGMLQRLGFVSALIHEPKLLILDEPLSGLDPLGRKEFKEIMSSLGKEEKTVFFSSHILNDVEEVSEDVVILESGSLIYSGNIDELISKKSTDDYEILIRGNEDSLKSHFPEALLSRGTVRLKKNGEGLNVFLESAIKNNFKIQSVNKITPNLEEIIYKTGI